MSKAEAIDLLRSSQCNEGKYKIFIKPSEIIWPFTFLSRSASGWEAAWRSLGHCRSCISPAQRNLCVIIRAMLITSWLYPCAWRLSLHMHALTPMERPHRMVSTVQCFGPLTIWHAKRKKGLLQASSHVITANGLQKVCADRDGHLRGRPFACLAARLCISRISGSQPITCRHKYSSFITSACKRHI